MVSGRPRYGTILMKLISFFNFAESIDRTILILVMIYVLGMGVMWTSGDEMVQ